MSNRPELPLVAAVGVWLTAVVGFGLMAAAVLGAVYSGFLDCSAIEVVDGVGAVEVVGVTDTANTSGGWLIAGVAVLMPLGVLLAVAADEDRALLVPIAVVVAAVEIWLWWLLLDPACQSDLARGITLLL